MADLPNCLLIVTAEVDASVEADWNRWYDDVHLPDALACPGVRAGRRYVSSGEISERDRHTERAAGVKASQCSRIRDRSSTIAAFLVTPVTSSIICVSSDPIEL